MSSSRIIFRQHPGSTSEEACELRARMWRYIFDCHAKKKAGATNTGNDGKEIEHGFPAIAKIPRK